MDDKAYNNKLSHITKVISISYIGDEAKDEANLLFKQLDSKAPGIIENPQLIPERIVKLGVNEIVITIILVTVAKKTLETMLDYLEKYLHEKLKKASKTNIQIVIKFDKTDSGKRFPFSASDLKPMALKVLFGTIREFISKIYSAK